MKKIFDQRLNEPKHTESAKPYTNTCMFFLVY